MKLKINWGTKSEVIYWIWNLSSFTMTLIHILNKKFIFYIKMIKLLKNKFIQI